MLFGRGYGGEIRSFFNEVTSDVEVPVESCNKECSSTINLLEVCVIITGERIRVVGGSSINVDKPVINNWIDPV